MWFYWSIFCILLFPQICTLCFPSKNCHCRQCNPNYPFFWNGYRSWGLQEDTCSCLDSSSIQCCTFHTNPSLKKFFRICLSSAIFLSQRKHSKKYIRRLSISNTWTLQLSSSSGTVVFLSRERIRCKFSSSILRNTDDKSCCSNKFRNFQSALPDTIGIFAYRWWSSLTCISCNWIYFLAPSSSCLESGGKMKFSW